MRDKELYTQILGIRSPWQVAEVELSVEAGEVKVIGVSGIGRRGSGGSEKRVMDRGMFRLLGIVVILGAGWAGAGERRASALATHWS